VKRIIGRAFVNPNSKIVARVYSPSKEGAGKGFFKRRIREAAARRLLRERKGPGRTGELPLLSRAEVHLR
jgi:23S rRNA G2069 N7-methylase RlmK/C1962 C5-methylase RlmI